MSVDSSLRVCVKSMRSRTVSRETSQEIVEAGQVCEGGQRQESLYNEQEEPDSKQRN